MTKTKKSLLLSLFLVTQGIMSQPYSSELDCTWKHDGCFRGDERVIDLRSQAAIHIDNLYSCQTSIEGCSEKEAQVIASIEGRHHLTNHDIARILQKTTPEQRKNYFVPLNITNKDLITMAAATSLGLVIFKNDGEIMDFIQENKTEETQEVADVANLFGREAQAPIILGSYFLGVVFKDGKLKDVGLIGLTAGLATQLVTEGFKKAFGRVRPNKAETPYDFFQGEKSFFSGHTSAAFSLATVLSEVYKEDYAFMPYLAYGAATLTAYARMHDKKHWATDVFAGAIAGHLITKFTYKIFKKEDSRTTGGLVITPYQDEFGGAGLNFHYTPKREAPEFKCNKIAQEYNLTVREKTRLCIQEAWERSNN